VIRCATIEHGLNKFPTRLNIWHVVTQLQVKYRNAGADLRTDELRSGLFDVLLGRMSPGSAGRLSSVFMGSERL